MNFLVNKYHNKKIVAYNQTFDSKKEMLRFLYLNSLYQKGEISELKRQVQFELIPAQYDGEKVDKNGRKIKRRCIERAVTYIADFTYLQGENYIVEDVKGIKTKDYIIKRKLMLYIKGIRIKEV